MSIYRYFSKTSTLFVFINTILFSNCYAFSSISLSTSISSSSLVGSSVTSELLFDSIFSDSYSASYVSEYKLFEIDSIDDPKTVNEDELREYLEINYGDKDIDLETTAELMQLYDKTAVEWLVNIKKVANNDVELLRLAKGADKLRLRQLEFEVALTNTDAQTSSNKKTNILDNFRNDYHHLVTGVKKP